jgi:6-phosphogluconolactonase
MKLQVLPDAESVAREGADYIAKAASLAVEKNGKFIFAASGGRTPWKMFRTLAAKTLPWESIQIVQVDERVVPGNGPDRNLTHLSESLLSLAPLPPENIHPMPVEQTDLAAACIAYAKILGELAGTPPALDLVHLGLGADGHTASLVPGDPVLEIAAMPVGTTGVYQGHHRMTLTYPALDRARSVLFIVTGEEKASALARLLKRDPTIPAGRLQSADITVIADQFAAAGVEHG